MDFNQEEVSNEYQMESVINFVFKNKSGFKVLTLENVKDALQKYDANLDDQAALEIANEFNDAQKSGICRFGLIKKEVENPNFGWHTLFAINRLIKNKRASNIPEAYYMLADFNDVQARGFSYYNLSKEQVKNPVFGWHTLFAMNRLIAGISGLDSHSAFEIVKEYNEDEVRQLFNNEFLRGSTRRSSECKKANQLGNLTTPVNEHEKKGSQQFLNGVSSDSDMDKKTRATRARKKIKK